MYYPGQSRFGYQQPFVQRPVAPQFFSPQPAIYPGQPQFYPSFPSYLPAAQPRQQVVQYQQPPVYPTFQPSAYPAFQPQVYPAFQSSPLGYFPLQATSTIKSPQKPPQQQKPAQPKPQQANDKKNQPDKQVQQKKPKNEQPVEEAPPAVKELEELALQYEDGFIYRGQGYPPHTRHGFGTLTDPQENEIYSGFWKDNNYSGEGRLINVDEADDHEIDWHNLAEIGHAWHKYEGEFAEGKFDGKGELFFKSNQYHIGQFHEGLVHGQGLFVSNQNYNIEGTWDKGHILTFKKIDQ